MSKKVIVLDDDDVILEVTQIALQSQGYKVTTINESKDLEAQLVKEQYDLLITDIFMPNKEGFEIICEAQNICPALKIVAMSGGVDFGDTLEIAKNLGSHEVLRKPFSEEDLFGLVEKVLGMA